MIVLCKYVKVRHPEESQNWSFVIVECSVYCSTMNRKLDSNSILKEKETHSYPKVVWQWKQYRGVPFPIYVQTEVDLILRCFNFWFLH